MLYVEPGSPTVYRVLIASIHDKGQCPCPRCLIPLKKIHNLGTPLDMKRRKTMVHIDDDSCRAKIEAACTAIYEGNLAVNNGALEALLKDQSLVATRASYWYLLQSC